MTIHGDDMETKICSNCKQEKALTEFYKMRASKDGYKARCKSCAKKDNRRCARNNSIKQKHTVSKTKTCARCGFVKSRIEFGKHLGQLDGKQAYCRLCMNGARKTDTKTKHTRNMKVVYTKYGISETKLQDILNKQRGLCCICNADFGDNLSNGNGRQYHIDHDHKTGKVRGLLCGPCNMALGHIETKSIDPQNFKKYVDQKGWQIGQQAAQSMKNDSEGKGSQPKPKGKNNDTTKVAA